MKFILEKVEQKTAKNSANPNFKFANAKQIKRLGNNRLDFRRFGTVTLIGRSILMISDESSWFVGQFVEAKGKSLGKMKEKHQLSFSKKRIIIAEWY